MPINTTASGQLETDVAIARARAEIAAEAARLRRSRRGSVAYHATSPERLPAIRRAGLLPQAQPPDRADERRAVGEPAIFFSAAPQWALLWGTVLLRFPFPEDADEDPYGDSVLGADGVIRYTNWFTLAPIPLGEIELCLGDPESEADWYPLVGLSEAGSLGRPGVK